MSFPLFSFRILMNQYDSIHKKMFISWLLESLRPNNFWSNRSCQTSANLFCFPCICRHICKAGWTSRHNLQTICTQKKKPRKTTLLSCCQKFLDYLWRFVWLSLSLHSVNQENTREKQSCYKWGFQKNVSTFVNRSPMYYSNTRSARQKARPCFVTRMKGMGGSPDWKKSF